MIDYVLRPNTSAWRYYLILIANMLLNDSVVNHLVILSVKTKEETTGISPSYLSETSVSARVFP